MGTGTETSGVHRLTAGKGDVKEMQAGIRAIILCSSIGIQEYTGA